MSLPTTPHTANVLTAASLLSTIAIPHVQVIMSEIATGISIVSGTMAIVMYISTFIRNRKKGD